MMEYRKISELNKLEGNPRCITENQMSKLVKSLQDNKDYFEARPLILSDRTGKLVVIAGNQRYEAARILGMSEVPTYLLKDLTEEREREIIIRDNVNNGSWDFDLLNNEWSDLPLEEWGMNLDGWVSEEEQPRLDKTEDKKPIICPECGHVFAK